MPKWDDRPAIEWIAEEFVHNAPHGRRLVAVDGADAARSARFADRLATAIVDASGGTASNGDVVRRSIGAVDEATLRGETIEPFRAGTLAGTAGADTDGANTDGADTDGADTVLVVDGQGLLDEAVRGVWHFSVWTLADAELPNSGATVIVDVSDESAPVRFFYDYCALPPSVNRPGLH